MFQSKKIAMAGLLGSLALIGAGAAQAVESPGNCTKDDKGQIRCIQVSEHRITERDGTVRVDNKTTQTCSGKGELTCSTTLVVEDENS